MYLNKTANNYNKQNCNICSRNTYSEIEDRVDADDLAKSLQKLGHKVTRKKMTSGINLIWKHKKSWVGTADPRREGVALAND